VKSGDPESYGPLGAVKEALLHTWRVPAATVAWQRLHLTIAMFYLSNNSEFAAEIYYHMYNIYTRLLNVRKILTLLYMSKVSI